MEREPSRLQMSDLNSMGKAIPGEIRGRAPLRLGKGVLDVWWPLHPWDFPKTRDQDLQKKPSKACRTFMAQAPALVPAVQGLCDRLPLQRDRS